eukprot:3430044-Rhodomonas_salina.3
MYESASHLTHSMFSNPLSFTSLCPAPHPSSCSLPSSVAAQTAPDVTASAEEPSHVSPRLGQGQHGV